MTNNQIFTFGIVIFLISFFVKDENKAALYLNGIFAIAILTLVTLREILEELERK